jgi:hypothetical protein
MSGLYGRKFKLTIVCNPNVEDQTKLDTIEIESEGVSSTGLRIIFDINYPGISATYFSEIIVYNMNPEFRKKVLKEGSVVVLEAGYEENCRVIFRGLLWQVLYERENVVDQKMILRCMDGDKLYTEGNMYNETILRGMNITTQINMVLSDSVKNIPLGETAKEEIETYLQDSGIQKMYRGETFFKQPADILHEKLGYRGINKTANIRFFAFHSVVEVQDDAKEYSYDKKNAIVISPNEGGLIGTPQQTMYGCNFTCLLNPMIVLKRPSCVVNLKGTGFQQMRARYGEDPIPTAGLGIADDYQIQQYQVIGVRHIGDSRGDQWYTYVTCCNLAGATPIGPQYI